MLVLTKEHGEITFDLILLHFKILNIHQIWNALYLRSHLFVTLHVKLEIGEFFVPFFIFFLLNSRNFWYFLLLLLFQLPVQLQICYEISWFTNFWISSRTSNGGIFKRVNNTHFYIFYNILIKILRQHNNRVV